MSDDSVECGQIIARLSVIEATQKAHAEIVMGKIATIEATLARIELQRAEERGQFNGATWALARVGAIAVILFSVIGWLITGGGLTTLKKLSGS